MKITRQFTQSGVSPFETVAYEKRTSLLRNPDGSRVSEVADVEVPADFSQVATDIMAQKYFRRSGVPEIDPATGKQRVDDKGKPVVRGERSVREVVHRLAGCWRYWGEEFGYFTSAEDAKAFYDELAHMLLHQMAAPNSPQWFNTGLTWAYGITGPAQGHYYVDPKTEQVTRSTDAYTRPQPHACQPWRALVSTPSGPVPIGRLVEDKAIGHEVFDKDGVTRVVAVKENGTKAVLRVVLKNGNTLEVTADHLVYAETEAAGKVGAGKKEWIGAGKLVPGMRLVQRTDTRIDARVEASALAVSEAFVAGWLQGDGFVGQSDHGTNRSLIVEFLTANDDEHEALLPHIDAVFPGVHFHVRMEDAQDEKLTIRRIRLYGEVLRAFVEKYELLRRGPDMSVPAPILEGGEDVVAAYLRALFQTDGAVRNHLGPTDSYDVVLGMISGDLVHQVQQLLANFGIYSRRSVCRDSREDRRPYWQLSLGYHSERSKFSERVGFVSHEKAQKLRYSLAPEVRGKSVPQYRYESILRIESIGEETVYDIQTESGSYLSGNIVVHNCFIQSVNDDLVNEGGIMDLWTREARVFKYGSGTGTNFSVLRAENEPLSGGGRSSGLMSFLKIGDRAAGAIKSGGTTRRAAKMVILDMDHPDIRTFINWKVEEERKVAALIKAGYTRDFNGDAYQTVSGQNSNNSVRVPQRFMEAVEKGDEWVTHWRTTGEEAARFPARDLWDDVAKAAWSCADPGVQFDTTINDWHTCPEDGRINASNPCSEYMFLDDTACNLASINLMKFFDTTTRTFDVAAFEHACRLWTVVLEISVLMAQFPSREIARRSYDYRTLGLGYANLGTLLMTAGLPYDSDEGRAWTGALTALMTGASYRTSAEMARELGPFPAYRRNADAMLRVIRNHRRAAWDALPDQYEGVSIAPMGIDPRHTPRPLLDAARRAWDEALEMGERHGYRNAQTTVIAPTGTIGLLMDCVAGDTRVMTELGEYTIEELCDYAVTGGVQVLDVLTVNPETHEVEWAPLNLAWIKPQMRELVEIECEIEENDEAGEPILDEATGAPRTRTTTLRCTPDHRVLTVEGWKKAGELGKGDSIVARSSRQSFGQWVSDSSADPHLLAENSAITVSL